MWGISRSYASPITNPEHRAKLVLKLCETVDHPPVRKHTYIVPQPVAVSSLLNEWEKAASPLHAQIAQLEETIMPTLQRERSRPMFGLEYAGGMICFGPSRS